MSCIEFYRILQERMNMSELREFYRIQKEKKNRRDEQSRVMQTEYDRAFEFESNDIVDNDGDVDNDYRAGCIFCARLTANRLPNGEYGEWNNK